LRKELSTNQMVVSLATQMPQVSSDSGFTDKVSREWFLYQHDTDILEAWWKDSDGILLPVDKYWAKVFQLKDAVGQPKYLHLSLIVRAALSVSHGQADVERGFSLNKQLLLDQRPDLKMKSIKGLRTVKDVLTKFDNITNVPLTLELFRRHRGAHAAYEKDLAEADSKSASDKSSDKKTDEHSEQEKSRKRKLELDSKQKDAEALILEANDRLQKAMTSKNMTEIMAAQALLQQGSKSLAEAQQEIEKTSDAKKTKDK
jgi:hypothetical protein